MKAVFLAAAFCVSVLVTAALAGAPPVPATAAPGCHGQPVAVQAATCNGINLQVPASVAAAECHGRRASRVTMAERREVRSMARSNYRATLAAGRAAAARGDGVAAVAYSAPSLEMAPVAACDCGCNPCECR